MRFGKSRSLGLLRNWQALFALVFAHALLAFGATNEPALHAESEFKKAREAQQADPKSDSAAWNFGRAAFDWAEFATNDTQRATIAVEAISICRELAERSPRLAQAHYYLGMNLGQLARTKTLGALKIVNEMEKEFKVARFLDSKFDHGGGDRNLGLLYRDAPGWPASIGSKIKARQHLTQALEIAPDYPENILNLAEAHLSWGEKPKARQELKALDDIWSAAKKQLAGPAWTASWIDWEKRRAEATHRCEK